jgi:hypothetical protein
MGGFPTRRSSSPRAPRHDGRLPQFHRILIHVSYPKVGSTWLQGDLFSHPAAVFWSPWRLEAKEHFLLANPYQFSAERVRSVFEPGGPGGAAARVGYGHQ